TASIPANWSAPWQNWFRELARRAHDGESVQPFKRDDPADNAALLQALAGVLNWQGESLIRYASAMICGDSKRLQTLGPRLRPALEAVTGHSSLEAFGILRKPRSVTFHGPLVLHLGDATLDYSSLPAPGGLSEANFARASL